MCVCVCAYVPWVVLHILFQIMKVPMFQRLVNEIKVRCGTAYCEQNEFPNENACGWEGDLGDFDVS